MTSNVLPIHRRIDERNRVGVGAALPTGYGSGISSQVHRSYHGEVLVVVTQGGIKHGFVFEPGAVILNYTAADRSHPRDLREMLMTISGSGRMAAVHELPGGVQDGHDQQDSINSQSQGNRQALEP